MPEPISAEPLHKESFRIAGRSHAPPQLPILTLEAYYAADHIMISPAGDLRGIVDDRLQAMGHSPRIVLGLPSFLPALAAAAASGSLVTLPARVATAFAPGFGLVTATPPLDVRPFPVSAFWHRSNDADPRTIWLRDQVRRV